jgi:hypothetical protein
MPALAVVRTESEPQPDRLAGLLAESSALALEYGRLAEQRAALARFSSEEAEIIGEIGEIGRREVEAVKAWAADPQGNPPAPLVKEREKAAHKLAAAQANAGAAGVAASEIEARQREVHAKQLALEPQIVAEIFDRIEAEFAEKSAELSRLITATRQAAAPLAALKVVLAEQGRALADSGQIDDARPFFARNERLKIPDLVETGPTNGEVAEAARYWRDRANGLRNGASQ